MACSSNEEPVTTVTTASQQRAIAIGDAYTAQPTRSSAAYSVEQGIDAGQSIGVYAYYHDGSTWDADEAYNTANPEAPKRLIPNFMWNQQATCLEKGGNFSYSPLKYWPNESDDKLSFIAYFPYTTLTVTDRVHFLFHHMTSKVEFRIVAATEVRKDIAHFLLKSFSVSNLYKDGKLTPTYNTSTDETSYAWSEQSAKHGTSPAYTFPLKTLTGYLMMPQTLSNDVKLSISYDVTFKSDGTTYTYDGEGRLVPQQDYTYSNDATIQLNTMKRTGTDTPLTEWLPNHHYVYYIRIGAETIEFEGQVVEWLDKVEIEDIEIQEP